MGSFIAGIALLMLGIRILYDPHIYNYVYRYELDLTGFNIPLGIAIIAGGILFLWSTFKGKSNQDE